MTSSKITEKIHGVCVYYVNLFTRYNTLVLLQSFFGGVFGGVFHRLTVVAVHTFYFLSFYFIYFCFIRFLVTDGCLSTRLEVHPGLYVRPDLEELIPTFLKFKSDSTTEFRLVPPFPATFVVTYIFKPWKGSTMQVISTWDTCQKSTKSKKAIILINHRIVTPLNNQFHSFLNLAPSPPNNVETAQRASTLNFIYHLI